MRSLILAAIGIALASPAAIADGMNLAGSLWRCTRASDQSQFVIAFYPGGGVGGGELENSAVSPYIIDASRTRPGEWPGQWEQTGQRFIWAFPDELSE
jgi:UDP-N-acetyl-D-mannosaminuronate dehydrogenase